MYFLCSNLSTLGDLEGLGTTSWVEEFTNSTFYHIGKVFWLFVVNSDIDVGLGGSLTSWSN